MSDKDLGNERPSDRPNKPGGKRAARKLPRVLPTSGEGDSDRAWGDSDDSNDENLRREKPPHW